MSLNTLIYKRSAHSFLRIYIFVWDFCMRFNHIVPRSNMVLRIYCEAYVVVLGWDIRINIWGVIAIVTMVLDFTWLSRHFTVQILLIWVASKSFHTAQILIQQEKKAEVQACFFLMHTASLYCLLRFLGTLFKAEVYYGQMQTFKYTFYNSRRLTNEIIIQVKCVVH